MNDPLLALEKITKYYGHKLIFKNLDLRIDPGEGLLVLGANGAGKSTLLRVMAGLSHPDNGSIHMKEGLRAAYLGHVPLLYPGLTAMENLAFWARAANAEASPEKLTAILADLNLLPYAHEPAGIFSRGMAQRLNFARVFLLDAELLLLDEPFTGLDSHSLLIIHDRLLACKKKGAAIAMVSHAPDADSWLADHIISLSSRHAPFSGNWQAYENFRAGPRTC